MANKYVTDEARKQIGKTWRGANERGRTRCDSPFCRGDRRHQSDLQQRSRRAPHALWRNGRAADLRTIAIGGRYPTSSSTCRPSRGLDGGSDWEYFVPIRPGDRITVQTKIADLRESAGRLGPMVFITTETTYTNQFGQVCAIQRSTAIRY